MKGIKTYCVCLAAILANYLLSTILVKFMSDVEREPDVKVAITEDP